MQDGSACQRCPQIRQDSAFFWTGSGVNNLSKAGPRATLFLAIAGVCVFFTNIISQVKTLLSVGCIDGCRSLNRSRILKLKKKILSGVKNLEQDRCRKMWLPPPLVYALCATNTLRKTFASLLEISHVCFIKLWTFTASTRSWVWWHSEWGSWAA